MNELLEVSSLLGVFPLLTDVLLHLELDLLLHLEHGVWSSVTVGSSFFEEVLPVSIFILFHDGTSLSDFVVVAVEKVPAERDEKIVLNSPNGLLSINPVVLETPDS